MAIIIDISHHQVPSKMNYDTLAKEVDLVIIRTQYGSRLIDRHYKTHHQAFQKRGIPTAAYAWVRGTSIKDMEQEATDFYERTKEFQPTFWFLDVEEQSMKDMREGVHAYLKKLRSLGAKNVGIYIGHHLYAGFNLNLAAADAVWIPHYGKNNGNPNSKPSYQCDLHQFTDKGKLTGYAGPLDLNRIISNKNLAYFTGGKSSTPKTDNPTATHIKWVGTDLKGKRVINIHHGPVHFYDAPRWTNPTGTFQPGEGWKVDNKYMVNGSPMYRVQNSQRQLFYITANEAYVAIKNDDATAKKQYHIVQQGDTVSQLALNYGTTTTTIKALNKLENIDKILVGQRLRVR